MTYLPRPVIVITDPEFPGTDAKVTTTGANGWEIDYLDNRNDPQSIFIYGHSWDKARLDFENEVEHSLIINHRAAKMEFDY